MVQGVTAVVLDALLLLQVVFLTVGAVFAVVAARGYRGSPWGRVLRPLPVVLVLFVVSAGVALLPVPWWGDVATYLWGVAILGIAVAVYEFLLLTTGRRAV